ncbi:MAG: DNA repair protein RadA, partial [Erythrobacter sp.]|nr:DNA repair protein RadA [Erythrobacter sp.]
RLREAAKLGFARCYGPAGAVSGERGADYRGLAALANVVDQVMGNA